MTAVAGPAMLTRQHVRCVGCFRAQPGPRGGVARPLWRERAQHLVLVEARDALRAAVAAVRSGLSSGLF